MGKLGNMVAGLTALMGLSATKTVQDAVSAGTYMAPPVVSKNMTTNAATKANRVQKRRAKAKKARVSRRKNRQ